MSYAPDHVHELELGGPDVTSNRGMLDRFTNWHIGSTSSGSRSRT
ncbi:hypothetical protein [Streptomyces sp. NPDC001820]